MKILVIPEPNLNMLDKREKAICGEKTLDEINTLLKKEAQALNAVPVHLPI